MNDYITTEIIKLLTIFVGCMGFLMICTGISYIIDAKGRYNYNTYWDNKDITDSGDIK